MVHGDMINREQTQRFGQQIVFEAILSVTLLHHDIAVEL